MEVTGNSIDEYTPGGLEKVKALCLSIAELIGDSIQEEAVIVGGLVPALLYGEVEPAWEFGSHAGTHDMDLALDLVILDKGRYEDVADRLKRSGFAPETTEKGNLRRQKWRGKNGATIDFLMPPVPPDTKGGSLQGLTDSLAAFTMRGLDLALKHRVLVTLSGKDLDGRSVQRSIPVCPAHVFIALKALAIALRDKPKDAYDIHFTLLHDSRGALQLGKLLHALMPSATVDKAVESLQRDYKAIDSRGPIDVCRFLGRINDMDLAGQALAYVLDFLRPFR